MMKGLILLCSMSLMLCDDSRQTYEDTSGKYVPGDEGQYIPDNSGQYIPDYSGLYHPDGTGRYSDDSTGKYQAQKENTGFGTTRYSNVKFANNVFEAASTNRKEENAEINKNIVRAVIPVSVPRPKTIDRNENYQNGKWKIIRQSENVDLDGYQWEYETENKILAQESGKVYNLGSDNEAMRAQGSFQYTGPDNVIYSVKYTADENGFVAVGDHLPTPPPIPVAIAKALEVLDRTDNKLRK